MVVNYAQSSNVRNLDHAHQTRFVKTHVIYTNGGKNCPTSKECNIVVQTDPYGCQKCPSATCSSKDCVPPSHCPALYCNLKGTNHWPDIDCPKNQRPKPIPQTDSDGCPACPVKKCVDKSCPIEYCPEVAPCPDLCAKCKNPKDCQLVDRIAPSGCKLCPTAKCKTRRTVKYWIKSGVLGTFLLRLQLIHDYAYSATNCELSRIS